MGSDAIVQIAGATSLPDGSYQFNFNVPTGTPTSGSIANIAITNGNGQFSVPATFFATAGNYTLSINAILTASGCNNLAENAAASFQVFAIPNDVGASVAAAAICQGDSNEVFISGANNLIDGTYLIDYQLSGANIATTTVTVSFTAGNGSFIIAATSLANPGTTTITITQLTLQSSQCGTSGVTFNAVTFDIGQLGTPVINAQGNEFCGTDNPTVADLSANISGSDPVIWYNAATDGTAYSATDLLINGTTYYGAYSSASGCESAVRLEVTVDTSKCNDLIITDGFSPNNDGINDNFVIKNLRELYPNFKLEIYNRYGNILYKGNINTSDWNGSSSEGGVKLSNGLLPVGVYFYILEFNDGARDPKQGRVYLSR